MSKRMLVDATHPEEIRVAIIQDQRLIDLDIETANREQIKGNIYLARVTRVEPSLQAAFIDYNGGRQGFLSINDIHNKYYPADEVEREEKSDPVVIPTTNIETVEEDETEIDELPPPEEIKPRPRRRNLPIQRILIRGQTLLVQVVKEARGNKGASLTTNISLAGRYTVLLPENSGGGGISRKIIDTQERSKLKEILSAMEIPNHVSLIIRTAGLGRTKREIARDMSYLLRLWNMIKEKTDNSKPPAIIHEEGDLIIRTIRDLYTTDMEEILVDGQEGYRRGKDFMRLLMPRYVKAVQPYKDSLPLFARYQVENQIESMHERKVSLKAGGYLVVDPTEAMVAIDINSGRSTREKNIENTAFKTNLQAAEEIARQLRLRDLGGLIVIDFIDMEDKKHNLEVEKCLKDAMKMDRAKIQIGRISQFGLLELSRQRMKPTFSETNRLECPRCSGLGTIRSVESAAIHLFHQIEEDVAKKRYNRLLYTTSQEMANYLLNNKRNQLQEMEANDLIILIHGDSKLQTPEYHKEHSERPKEETKESLDTNKETLETIHKEEVTNASTPETTTEEQQETKEPVEKKRRRRRRRKPAPIDSTLTPKEGASESLNDQNQKQSDDGGLVATNVPGIFVLSATDTDANQPTVASTNSTEEPLSEEPPPSRPKRRRRRRKSNANRHPQERHSTLQTNSESSTKPLDESTSHSAVSPLLVDESKPSIEPQSNQTSVPTETQQPDQPKETQQPDQPKETQKLDQSKKTQQPDQPKETQQLDQPKPSTEFDTIQTSVPTENEALFTLSPEPDPIPYQPKSTDIATDSIVTTDPVVTTEETLEPSPSIDPHPKQTEMPSQSDFVFTISPEPEPIQYEPETSIVSKEKPLQHMLEFPIVSKEQPPQHMLESPIDSKKQPTDKEQPTEFQTTPLETKTTHLDAPPEDTTPSIESKNPTMDSNHDLDH